jgi:DNA-3-methyladenine glycosylase II
MQAIQLDDTMQPASEEIRKAVKHLYSIAPQFKGIEKVAGPLTVRRGTPTFATLVRIVVGQQLAIKAAASIYARLNSTISLTPQAMLKAKDSTLAEAGLSKSKIATCLAIAQAIQDKDLVIEKLGAMSDDDIRTTLTKIRGIGSWTAEIFLLFCLSRLDAWPHSDLGLQLGYQSLCKLKERPDTRALLIIGEDFRPVRGAAAYLLWHYYRHLKSS